MYEVVWNGGPGLTTYTAQRPGAVLIDVKEGDAAQWIELQQYDATHPHRIPGAETDSFPYVTLYDTAYVRQPAYRWAVARLAASWSRVLTYARYGGWPSCHLCGKLIPRYGMGFGTRGGGRNMEGRVHETPRHRAACQSCYVSYRVARGRWAGVDSLTAWRATRPVLTSAERLEHRRAISRASYQRRLARMTPGQLAQRRAAENARYHQMKAARQAALQEIQTVEHGPHGDQGAHD